MPIVGPPTRPGLSPAAPADTSFLETNNARFADVVKRTPGVTAFLARNSVSSGPRTGEVSTPVSWSFWNHSAATSKKYGHGMTDDMIKGDVIVVFQPTTTPGAGVDFGGRQFPGHEIIGVFQVGDQVNGTSPVDGGFLGNMRLSAHGAAGSKAVLAWAVVSIAPDGHVRGGGYPTTSGTAPVPYQRNANGSEYHGRAAEVVHGQQAHVPITDE